MNAFQLALICLFFAATAAPGSAEPDRSPGPIRLADGSPLVGIYYFTHWWEPWRSSDERILADLARLKQMGCNTIFLDHEWSQMIDGDWAILDRAHALARKAGMQILPWLSAKVWLDIGTDPGRREKIRQMYGVTLDQGVTPDGKPGRTKPYDPAVIEAGVRYCQDYLKRYEQSGALLNVKWNGRLRPVIAPTVELEWETSCDSTTNQMLRLWLRAKYDDIGKLNKSWKTSIKSFADIDICDKSLFDLDGHIRGRADHPAAVEDQVEFRAQVTDTALAEIQRRLREKNPDLVFVTELPYQFESTHPDAIGYRIKGGANPSAAMHADILMVRATDSLTAPESAVLSDYRRKTGQKIILTYRTYAEWGKHLLDGSRTVEEMRKSYARQAADLADGFGFYSWNEMVDTHVVSDPDPPHHPTSRITPEQSDAVIGALGAMAAEYREASDKR